MQKLYISVIAFIALVLPFFAKAQVSYTSNTGGTSSDYVGWDNTNNFPLQIKHEGNQPINFFTANTERMRIDTNGNVGIGTATPSHTLDVNGTVAAKQILIEEKDILALLTELQSRIVALEK